MVKGENMFTRHVNMHDIPGDQASCIVHLKMNRTEVTSTIVEPIREHSSLSLGRWCFHLSPAESQLNPDVCSCIGALINMLMVQSDRSVTDHQSWVSTSPLPSGDLRGSNGVSQGFQQRMAWMQVAMVTARQVTKAPWQGWMREMKRGRAVENKERDEGDGVKVEER